MSHKCCQSLRNLFSKSPNNPQSNHKTTANTSPKITITKISIQKKQNLSTDNLYGSQAPPPKKKQPLTNILHYISDPHVCYYTESTERPKPKIQIKNLEPIEEEGSSSIEKHKKKGIQEDIHIQLIPTSKQYKTNNQTNPKQQEQITHCKLTIKFINNKSIRFDFQNAKTIDDLKKYICRKYQKQFQYQQIAIWSKSTLLNSKTILKDILKNNKASLTVKKAELYEIQELTTDRNGIDEISAEQGVAKARCGHLISRGHMDQLVKYQIKALKNNQIHCPHLNKDGAACEGKFQMHFCRLVAGFTNDDMRTFGNQLNENWKLKFAISCPQCTFATSKQNLNTKKLTCQACGFGPYCTDCRQKCIGDQAAICRSVLCEYLRANVVNAPWTRVFMMYKFPDTDNTFPVKVPNVRLCPRPNCRQLVINTDDCKHTKCSCIRNGRYSFCYVCLSLAPETGDNWKCGGGFEYCGFVAPNQVYNAQ